MALSKEDVKWVVNSLGELGVCVHGRYFFLYKGESLEYGSSPGRVADGVAVRGDGTKMKVRPVGKREFGEVCHPLGSLIVVDGQIQDHTPIPYTVELKFRPGLSFGDEGDYAWEDLPAAPYFYQKKIEEESSVIKSCGDDDTDTYMTRGHVDKALFSQDVIKQYAIPARKVRGVIIEHAYWVEEEDGGYQASVAGAPGAFPVTFMTLY